MFALLCLISFLKVFETLFLLWLHWVFTVPLWLRCPVAHGILHWKVDS